MMSSGGSGAAAPAPVAIAPAGSRLRLDARALWVWVLSFALVLYLGTKGGGYDLVVRSEAGIVVWWALLLGALTGVLPAARLGRWGWGAVGLLGAFTAFSLLASSWSLSSEDTLAEVSRLASYLGVLLLALLSYGDRRAALRHVVAAVGTAIAVLAVLALISRLRPGTFPGAETTASFLPGTQRRLGWPLNYWNALAALVALGVPLLLALATSARTLLAQALAAAAVPLLVLCAYLTFSRGGALAMAVAVIAFIALAPERLPKLVTVVLCAAGGAALVAGAARRHAVEQGLTNAAAHHQGAALLLAAVLVSAGVGVAQVGVGLLARHGRWIEIPAAWARRGLAVLVVVAVVAGLAAGGTGRLSRAWHDFKQPATATLHENGLARFGSLSGNDRYLYWRAAVHSMPGHWLGGHGPGTYQLVWLPRAPVYDYVRNAHSLYVETLSDTGIVGLLLLGGFLVVLLAGAVRRVVVGRVEDRALAAAVAAATIAFLLSAGLDWVWQVPVLPVALLLLLGAVLGPEWRRRARDAAGGPGALGGLGGLGALAGRGAVAVLSLAALVAIAIPLASTTAVRASQAAVAAGQDGTALADARTAIRVEPDAASAHLQAALVLELGHEIPPALVEARRAAALEPQNWQVWLVLSRLEAEDAQPAAAVASYRRARSLNPQSPLFS